MIRAAELHWETVNSKRNKEITMLMDVETELATLRTQTVGELQQRFREVYGEATRSRNKDFLVKRIIWKMQALREGGLSERARRRAEQIADETALRLNAPPEFWKTEPDQKIQNGFLGKKRGGLQLGTELTREHNGKIHRVRVLDGGFEYAGQIFRSLSAVAREITGTRWNGHLFFGLKNTVRKSS